MTGAAEDKSLEDKVMQESVMPALAYRLATGADAEACRAIYAPAVTEGSTSFEYEVPSMQEFRGRMEETLKDHPWIVAERTINGVTQVVGYSYAGLIRFRTAYQWSREVAVYVGQKHHGQGIGTALYRTLFEVLRGMGVMNVYGGVTQPNPASDRLHDAMGMRLVGTYEGIGYKFQQWHDVTWYQGQLRDRSSFEGFPVVSMEIARDFIEGWLRSGARPPFTIPTESTP